MQFPLLLPPHPRRAYTLSRMTQITPIPFAKPFTATVVPPGSKSMTNRALVIAALANGTSHISNILLADDTLVMIESLRRLGFDMQIDQPGHTVHVVGSRGKVPARGADLFCGNSGTTIRFLCALCSLGKGEFALDGVPRMRQRPIGELGAMLKNLGVRIGYPDNDGFPPIQVAADGLPGGRLHFGVFQSSQYLSAILQIAPYARHEVVVDLAWPQTSWPYVTMTMRLMDEFGSTPELICDEDTHNPERIHIPRMPYSAREYTVEPDASSASYFLAAAAIREDATLTIKNLGKHSLQGDVGFAELLCRMGASRTVGSDSITITGTGELHGIDVSLADMPDMAQTLAVVALFADGTTTLRDLRTLRVKETDRIAALATELKKLGAGVEVEGDTLTIEPPAHLRPATIETYDDHRMAMSFAVAATRESGITINDPECVNKTYPDFFAELSRLSE